MDLLEAFIEDLATYTGITPCCYNSVEAYAEARAKFKQLVKEDYLETVGFQTAEYRDAYAMYTKGFNRGNYHA